MEEIEVGCRIGGAAEEFPFMDETEGVLLTTSEIEARGREAAGAAALDLSDATEPEGETTEAREGALASAGAGLEDMEDVRDDNKVPRDFGVGGAPVADGALGGSMDVRRDGCGGLLEDAIVDVVFTGELAEEVLMDFLKVEGAEVVVFERVGGVAEGPLLPEAGFVAPDPNVPELNTFFTVGVGGPDLVGIDLADITPLSLPVFTAAIEVVSFLVTSGFEAGAASLGMSPGCVASCVTIGSITSSSTAPSAGVPISFSSSCATGSGSTTTNASCSP